MYRDRLKQQRETALAKAETIITAAEQTNRALTSAEQTDVDACMLTVKEVNAQIVRSENLQDLRTQFPSNFFDKPGNGTPAGKSLFSEVDKFISSGFVSPTISAAALTESDGLAVAVPPFQLEQFRAAYPSLTPFEAAGATVFNSSNFGMVKIKVPFILSGEAATTYAEGDGPTTVQDASVVGIELEPAKYAFLTKISEEADADIPNLGQSITQEGVSRLYQSTSAAVSTALIESLVAAGAIVPKIGVDALEYLLSLEASIPAQWASTSNVLMLSRTSLAGLRNTRDGNDKPIFDPITKQILGYRTVINDNLDTNLVFGNWQQGAYLSYSQLMVQRLDQVYRGEGKIGVRFARRAASAFFSDASSDAANQPLYVLDLGSGS